MNSNGPSLGIVTICWNNLAGLQATVASAVSQHRPPDHMFIIDGGSSDGTVEWLDATDLPSWVEWQSGPDGGIYDAMNKGKRRALDYDLVMFMNSGDTFASSDVVGRIDQHYRINSWAWAYGDSAMVGADGQLEWMHELRHFRSLRFRLGLGSVPHQAVTFTSDLLRTVGDFRTDIGIMADQEHIFRCWQLAEPAYLRWEIARCDASGVSSMEAPGNFADKMAVVRRDERGPVFNSNQIDQVMTYLARAYLRSRARARTRRQLKRASKG